MKESQYIFDSSNSLSNISIIISCLIAIIIIYFIAKLNNDFISKEIRNKYLLYIGLLLAFILMLLDGSRSDSKYYNEIKNNLAIAEGRTIKHEVGDGYNHITFEYQINGKYYKGQSGITYNGQTIKNIVVPNGRYKVLYNRKNPNMAVMDFKVKKY